MGTPPAETSHLPDQEHVAARRQASKRANKQQVRLRASIACASCRGRRIRCVVPKGETECTQCRKTQTECVIKNDDERRRPVSKAYMTSLAERISLLEGMLQSQGVAPPPASYPPKSRQSVPADKQADRELRKGKQYRVQQKESSEKPSSRSELHESCRTSGNVQQTHLEQDVFSPPDWFIADIAVSDTDSTRSDAAGVHSSRCKANGASPTADSNSPHGGVETADFNIHTSDACRVKLLINSLHKDTHDHVMRCFWDHYNATFHVVDRAVFEAEILLDSPRFYSLFLHITMLAAGFRFADKDRRDIKCLDVGGYESTLHKESKGMLSAELEQPGMIASLQALLILSDLEFGTGRSNTGWMHSGMANRLAIELGLHLHCRQDLDDTEVRVRHQLMKSCALYDRYWASLLGRPTTIRNDDIDLDLLDQKSLSATAIVAPDSASSLSARVRLPWPADNGAYEQLVELMELASNPTGKSDISKVDRRSSSARDEDTLLRKDLEDDAYMHLTSMDRQLQNWYRRLPDNLRWKQANVTSASSNFFLLHQQYYVSMILLHGPWAKYKVVPTGKSSEDQDYTQADHESNSVLSNIFSLQGLLAYRDTQSVTEETRAWFSRSICTQQAVRVARIFWQYRQRFDGKKFCIASIQHAWAAALVLIASLGGPRNERESQIYLRCLEELSEAIGDMSHTYHAAAEMDGILKGLLPRLRIGVGTRNDILREASTPSPLLLDRTRGGSVAKESKHNASPMVNRTSLPTRRTSPESDDSWTPETPQLVPSAPELANPVAALLHSHSFSADYSSSSSHDLHALFQDHGPMVGGAFSQFENYGLDVLSGSGMDVDGLGKLRGSSSWALKGPVGRPEWWSQAGLGSNKGFYHGTSLDAAMPDWLSATIQPSGPGIHRRSSQHHPANLRPAARNSGGRTANLGSPVSAVATTAGEPSLLHAEWHTSSRESDKELERNRAAGFAGNRRGSGWMETDDGYRTLDPVPVSGQRQKLGRGIDSKPKLDSNEDEPRNHDLDYLRL